MLKGKSRQSKAVVVLPRHATVRTILTVLGFSIVYLFATITRGMTSVKNGLYDTDEDRRLVDSPLEGGIPEGNRTNKLESNHLKQAESDMLEVMTKTFNTTKASNYHEQVLHATISSFSPASTAAWVNKTIRKWGCHRTETPTIFVHIGKAGGGMIRARFAAAALNYDRGLWKSALQDNHYYAVSPSVNASFCNSLYFNLRHPESKVWEWTYEGNLPCLATTPIGMALGCPEPTKKETARCLGCRNLTSSDCHTVYTGHNNIGSEIHWLPPPYLEKWWRSTNWSHGDGEQDGLMVDWKTIRVDEGPWCFADSSDHSRPKHLPNYVKIFPNCSIPIGREWDEKFQSFWLNHKSFNKARRDSSEPVNYSPIYASMPVQRITMMREPWSWLVSKFFWYPYLYKPLKCDDLEHAKNWTYGMTLHYIGNICGDDCATRFDQGLMTVPELVIQSESNLRHAFSVVGLLNETETFYDMVSTRVGYLDMRRNPHVRGKLHASGGDEEKIRCNKAYRDPSFQSSLKELVPFVAVLEHLYEVAVEVNRFQLEELRTCENAQWSLNEVNF